MAGGGRGCPVARYSRQRPPAVKSKAGGRLDLPRVLLPEQDPVPRDISNLRAYLDLAGVQSGAGDKAALASLLRGAFPALSEEEAASLVA